MKTRFAFLLAAFLPVQLFCGSAAPSVDTWKPGPGWKLVWADEFDGASLSSTNWVYDLGASGWGNKELQNYTDKPANCYLENGQLVIKAIKEGDKYTSARLKTKGKQSWKYGKVAARMRLPYGQGIWPAFWMMGDTRVGWPRCGEIDIMEMIGGGEHRDNTHYGTLHWQGTNSHASHGSGPHELPKPHFFHQDYHVFEVEWNAKEVIWKLDGAEYFRTSVDVARHPTMEEFHGPFFILLNLAVGGNWPGNPNPSTVFPQYLYVDWVRVYQ